VNAAILDGVENMSLLDCAPSVGVHGMTLWHREPKPEVLAL